MALEIRVLGAKMYDAGLEPVDALDESRDERHELVRLGGKRHSDSVQVAHDERQ